MEVPLTLMRWRIIISLVSENNYRYYEYFHPNKSSSTKFDFSFIKNRNMMKSKSFKTIKYYKTIWHK